MLNSQVCDTQVAAEEREDRETRCYNEQVHVLAVDDCRLDLKIIEKLLKKFSFKVTAVESAEKALEMLGLGLSDEPNACNGFKVNLIITDYCMPGMSGYDLLKKVKEARALQDIPVVIISSEHVPQRITSCLEEGAEDFIMKPVKVADIVRLNGRLKEPRKSDAGARSSSNEDASTNCNHDDKDHDQESGTVAVGIRRKRKAISSGGGSSTKKSSSFAPVVFQNQREGLR